MFTGIIEATGTVTSLKQTGGNLDIVVESPISHELKIDQSVSHNGVCLTVVEVSGNTHRVTAIDETLKKTNLGSLVVGDEINLERCMKADGRFDGHVVQGHVDQKGSCLSVTENDGSWVLQFSYTPMRENVVVEKGSICINGISLTAFDAQENTFKVAIIPYTWQHTNISGIKPGNAVNLEFDIIGKYVARMVQFKL
ncbi:MAG TPA: riboflavin synthase [Chitinophagales bacterium]|nr:riboflavin synthase [Chitinophagales bacterium]